MNEDTRKHLELWTEAIRGRARREDPVSRELDPNVEPDKGMIEYMRNALYSPCNTHIPDATKAELLQQYIDGRMYPIVIGNEEIQVGGENELQITITMSYDYNKDKENETT